MVVAVAMVTVDIEVAIRGEIVVSTLAMVVVTVAVEEVVAAGGSAAIDLEVCPYVCYCLY